MKYTIWRMSPDGSAFQLTTAGAISNKESALNKARIFNEKLQVSDPGSEDQFIVRDNKGRELKPPA